MLHTVQWQTRHPVPEDPWVKATVVVVMKDFTLMRRHQGVDGAVPALLTPARDILRRRKGFALLPRV